MPEMSARMVGSWTWRLLQAASLVVAALFVYVFFFHIVTEFRLWGLAIRGPGDLAVPVLLALAVLALSLKPWQWSDRRAKGALLLLFLFFFCVLFHPHAGSDAAQYYAGLRTLWLDQDLNFYDDAYRNLGLEYLCTLHERGYTYNGFSLGPAFFWSPFFLLAHLWCLVGNSFAVRYAAEGYDRIYLLAVCASSSLYGLAGAAIGFRLLRRWVSSGAAALALALGMFASPLLLYLFIEGAYSHALGFFLGAAVVALWWKRYEATARPQDGQAPLGLSAAFGLACGLSMLVRWQSGLFLLFPLFDFVGQGWDRMCRREAPVRSWREFAAPHLVFASFFLLAFLPQMAAWRVQTGHWFLVPQGGGYLANWWKPQIGKVLFSRLHGLFSWHPALLVATLCLPLMWRKHRALLVRAVPVLAGQLYINSVVHDWWAGGSFGQRRFCVVLILFAVPLALGLERVFRWASQAKRGPTVRALVVLAIVFLVLSNFLLAAQYVHGPVGAMGKLHLGEYLARWVAKEPNVFTTVRNNFLFNPLINGIGYGVLRLDFRLLLVPLLQLTVVGFVGALILWPGGLLRLPGAAWVRRRSALLLTMALLAFLGLVGYCGWNARLLWVLNLRPDVPFGNVRPLSVARTHRYVGGYVNRPLEPGESLGAVLDRRIQARSVLVTSYVKGVESLPLDTPVARLTVKSPEGQAFETTLRVGQHTEVSNALARRPSVAGGNALPPVARRWRPSPHAMHNACSWYAEWPLPEARAIREVRLESLLGEGRLQVEGIAFRPAEPGALNPVAEMARRSQPLDFHRLCNVAYDHNVFSLGDYQDYSHFQLPESSLYNGPVELRLYPPYEVTKEWNALTTCYQDGAVFRIPVRPPCRLEALHVAYAAGLIRTRQREPITDIVLVYESGEEQRRRLETNVTAFEYLDGYRPGGTVLAGGSSSYMYDGRVSLLVIEAERRGEPLVEVRIEDANGSDPAGISVLALTAVAPPEATSGEEKVAKKALPVEGDYRAMAYDGASERFLLADRYGRLEWVTLDGRREPIAAPPGALSAVAVAPGGEGYYALLEDGTVLACEGAAHYGNAEAPRTRYAVDLQIDPSGRGYHVLLSDGEVVSRGKVAFPGWRRKVRGVFVAFTVSPSGETWLGLTRQGAMVWAGREPGFPIWDRPNWGWDIGRDILATSGGAVVLDGFGGLHPFGAETYRTFQGYAEVDRCVALEALPDEGWAILDREGTVHTVPQPQP